MDVQYAKDDYHSSFQESLTVRLRVDFEFFDLIIDTTKYYASDFNIGDKLEVSGIMDGNILYDVEILK